MKRIRKALIHRAYCWPSALVLYVVGKSIHRAHRPPKISYQYWTSMRAGCLWNWNMLERLDDEYLSLLRISDICKCYSSIFGCFQKPHWGICTLLPWIREKISLYSKFSSSSPAKIMEQIIGEIKNEPFDRSYNQWGSKMNLVLYTDTVLDSVPYKLNRRQSCVWVFRKDEGLLKEVSNRYLIIMISK